MVFGIIILVPNTRCQISGPRNQGGRGRRGLSRRAKPMHGYSPISAAWQQGLQLWPASVPSWAPLMKIIGRTELIEDPNYATPEARLLRIPECFSIIEKWTITKSKFEVMAALNEADVPCGPILSMKDIYEDKELFERGMLVEIDHPERGRYVQVGMPIKLSDSPADVKRSPLLGEHTDEVLGWLGYDSAGIKTLHDDGAV